MSQKQHHKDDENQTENGMVRGLQNRHVQLIAIAGTIGTGLFLGAGRSLSLTGPSIILVCNTGSRVGLPGRFRLSS